MSGCKENTHSATYFHLLSLTGRQMLNIPVLGELTYFRLFSLLGDCRFSATKGNSLSWDNIRDGINLTVEIAKVQDKDTK